MKTKRYLLTACAAGALLAGGLASAAQTVPDERARMSAPVGMVTSNVNVPMSSAILRAEARFGGPAVKAQLVSAANGPAYLIAVENPDGRGVIDMQIDADTGKIAPRPDPMLLKEFTSHRSGV